MAAKPHTRRKFSAKQKYTLPPTTNYGRAPQHETTERLAQRGSYVDSTAPKKVNIYYSDLHRDVRPVTRGTLSEEEIAVHLAKLREKRKRKNQHHLR